MERTANILAAFEAGKIPSSQQISQWIDVLNNQLIPNVTPDDNGGLSSNGVALAHSTRQLLDAYNQLGLNKNKDNIIQQIIWHASKADLDATTTDVTSMDTSGASRDAKRAKRSFSTIFQIFWSSLSSEGMPLFADFNSFVRLALADAAEVLESQAGKAKEGLRDVDQEVKDGQRNVVGLQKHEDNDAQAKFERGMDTVKETGSSLIGASQTAVEKTSQVAEDTTSRLQQSYDKIIDRALADDDYQAALDKIFSIAEKWLNRSLDALHTQKDPSQLTLADFIDDPTPEQHAAKSLGLFSTLLDRLTGGASFGALFESLRNAALDIREDPELKKWFDEFFDYAKKSLNQRDYAKSEEAKSTRNNLNKRWKKMINGETEGAKKWSRDVDRVKAESHRLEQAISNDADLKRIRRAHTDFKIRGEETAATMLEAATWFWTDLIKVYLPKTFDLVKDIPIPRTEYKDEEVEFVLENLDVSTLNFLPAHTYIRNITDVDITTSATHSNTTLGTLTHIRIQAIQLALSDVSFWYRDKNTIDVSGLLSFAVPEKGLDVDLQVRLIPDVDERVKKGGHYHVIEKCEVHISEEAQLSIKESNHGVLLTLFKPIFTSRVRQALEDVLAQQLSTSVLFLDGMAFDIGRRKEVFKDTGLGEGASLAAAMWSEIGRFARGERTTSFNATGTGLVVKDEAQGKSFAMGVEPQILSGEKRGPVGTGSQSIEEKLGVKGSGDSAMEGVEHAKDVAKDVAKEGVKQVKSFKRTVEMRKQSEEANPGWESSAFDL